MLDTFWEGLLGGPGDVPGVADLMRLHGLKEEARALPVLADGLRVLPGPAYGRMLVRAVRSLMAYTPAERAAWFAAFDARGLDLTW